MPQPFGILNVNKPAGSTSRDVVDRVQRFVRPAKAGHAGTLDPLATGVLVVCVGFATRLIEYVQKLPKRYEATFLLGRRSDTEDVEGTVKLLDRPNIPSREALEELLPSFLGEIEQRPPAFSAVKVQGKRAYALARAGQQVDLEPRKVFVEKLTIHDFAYPRLRLSITCGSGTYVRALGRDIAEAVGTGAIMSELCRVAIGDFTLDEAVHVDALQAGDLGRALRPPSTAVAHLPRLEVTPADVEELWHGRSLDRPVACAPAASEQPGRLGPEIAAVDHEGRLVAILVADSRGRLKPHRNFAHAL